MDVGVLQRILDDIGVQIGQGAQNLDPLLFGYLTLFGFFAMLWLAYGIIWNGHALPSALTLVFRLALVTLALARWPWLLEGMRGLGVSLGLFATGSRLAVAEFLDPGALVRLGLKSGVPLFKAAYDTLGLTTLPLVFAYLLAWLAFVAAFGVMAWKVFFWQLELMLAALAGLVLLPLLAFKPMASMAGGVLSYAANAFVRFFLGALLAGLLWKWLDTLIALSTAPVGTGLKAVDVFIQSAAVAVLTVWCLAGCFLAVNRMAGAFTSGIPGMAGGSSFGSLLRTVGGGAAVLATGGAAAAAGALGAAQAGAAGVQGAIGAAGALKGIATGASGAHSLGGMARQLYAGTRAGMSGGAQAKLASYMGTAGHVATKSGTMALRQYMAASRQAGHDQAHGGIRR